MNQFWLFNKFKVNFFPLNSIERALISKKEKKDNDPLEPKFLCILPLLQNRSSKKDSSLFCEKRKQYSKKQKTKHYSSSSFFFIPVKN
jgi:hypothetical protein